MSALLLWLRIWKSFWKVLVALPHSQPGLWGFLRFLLLGEHGELGGMRAQSQQGRPCPAGTHGASCARAAGHCPGALQQPSTQPADWAEGKRQDEGKPGVNIAMQDSFYCRGRAAGAGQKSRVMAKGLPWPGPGHCQVSRSSPRRVSGSTGAPAAPRGCSGRAGTRQSCFPSWHQAPELQGPAMPEGFWSAERRVGMRRAFSWSSSRAGAALGLSRARSCH